MFSYFRNSKTTYFDVFCLNFSIETKIKTLFQISYFNLSKKRNGTLGTRIRNKMLLDNIRNEFFLNFLSLPLCSTTGYTEEIKFAAEGKKVPSCLASSIAFMILLFIMFRCCLCHQCCIQ